MTLEQAILARSYLPKDGTYSMVDHILANQMNVVGTQVGLSISVDNTPINISEAKVSIKVKDSTIATKVVEEVNSITINREEINIKVGCDG